MEFLSSLIADTALRHYADVLPKKGKPIPGKEWTVYSAIVATQMSSNEHECEDVACVGKGGKVENNRGEKIERAWVVSCATGSKCTAVHAAVSSNFSMVDIPPCGLSAATSNPNSDAANNMPRGGKFCNACCCQDQTRGLILHDSHAEILARRGLIRVLWKEIKHHLSELSDVSPCGDNGRTNNVDECMLLDRIVEVCPEEERNKISFCLKGGIQLHLYISDNPCGDSSIYELSPKYSLPTKKERSLNGNINFPDKELEGNGNLNFTGAKIIMPSIPISAHDVEMDNFTPCGESVKEESNKGTDQADHANKNIISIAREKHQILSALRLKSGRSNLPQHLRSSSHSCSDKICKWIVLGLQGSGMLSSLLSNPIYLSSIVVSADERAESDASSDGLKAKNNGQIQALERALNTRATMAMNVVAEKNSELHSRIVSHMIVPKIFICSQIFRDGKAVTEKFMHDVRMRNNPTSSIISKKRKSVDISYPDEQNSKHQFTKKCLSPSGISINWQISLANDKNNNIEQIVGAKGIRQGKKSKRLQEVLPCASRLSRYVLFFDSVECSYLLKGAKVTPRDNESWAKFLRTQEHKRECEAIEMSTATGYQMTKQMLANSDLKRLKSIIFNQIESPLVGWLRRLDDHDFKCHYTSRIQRKFTRRTQN